MDGKTFEVNRAVNVEQVIAAYLDKAPEGEVYRTTDLAARLGRDTGEVSKRHRKMPDYCVMCPPPQGSVWGSKKTIAALRKALKEQGFDAR